MKAYKGDILKFLGWLAAAFLAFNVLPKGSAVLFILILSVQSIRKNDAVVFLLVFLAILTNLGGFFTGKHDIVNIGPIEIDIVMIIVFSSYIKFLLLKTQDYQPFILRKPIVIFSLYTLFLVIWGLVLGIEPAGESGLRHHFQLGRTIVLFPIFLILPRLLNSHKFVEKFAALLFVSVFINLIGQFFMLITGLSLSEVLRPNPLMELDAGQINYMTDMLRPVYGAWFSLLSLFLGFYYLIKPGNSFSRRFLYLIIFLSFFSIFITATRGWILAFLFFILISSIIVSKQVFLKTLGGGLFAILVFFILYSNVSVFKVQVEKAFDRFATVELIIEGDISAGGTSIRHLRGQEVMQGFYKSPLVGLGFSSEALALSDQHVGNQAILMSGGVMGFFIIIMILYQIGKKALFVGRSALASPTLHYNRELVFIPIFLFAIFVIHSTSTTFFGYSNYVIAYGNMLWIVFVFSLFNRILLDYVRP